MGLTDQCLWADRRQAQNLYKGPYSRNLKWKLLATHLITIESPGKWNSSVKRIPEDTHVNEDLLYKESVLSIMCGVIQEDS